MRMKKLLTDYVTPSSVSAVATFTIAALGARAGLRSKQLEQPVKDNLDSSLEITHNPNTLKTN